MPTNDTLTFTELERRLRAVPDGPAGMLNTPPLYRIAETGVRCLTAWPVASPPGRHPSISSRAEYFRWPRLA